MASFGVSCASMAPSIVHGTQRMVVAQDISYPTNSLSAWGSNGLVAYALAEHEHHYTVFILDASSMQLVQTLNGHAQPISALAWLPQKASQFDQNSVNLIVADRGGAIGLWDVSEGCVQRMAQLPEGEVARSLAFIGRGMGPSETSSLLAICESGASYVLESMLGSPECRPFRPMAKRIPAKGFCRSRLTDVCAVVHDATVRVYKGLDRGEGASFQSEVLSSGGGEDGEDPSNGLGLGGARYSVTQLQLDTPSASSFVDACFSTANSEVVFVASPTTIATVDWSLSLTLNTQLLWLSTPGVTFRRIFPSYPSRVTAMPIAPAAWVGTASDDESDDSASGSYGSSSSRGSDEEWSSDDESSTCDSSSSWSSSSGGWNNPRSRSRRGSSSSSASSSSSWGDELSDDERGGEVAPVLYTYTSDLKLTAWAVADLDTIRAHAIDVRGVRLTTRHVLTVTQSEMDTTRFIVVFTDGSAVHWRFLPSALRWVMCAYHEAAVFRPVALAAVGLSAVCIGLDSGALVVHDVQHGHTLKRAHIVKAGSTKITCLVAMTRGSLSPAVTSPTVVGCGGGQGSLGHVLVGTVKAERHGSFLQVTIVNLDAMAVVRTLRRGAPTARRGQESSSGGGSGGASAAAQNSIPTDASPFKDMRLDASERYLLISFENNTFEVWNIETESLIHIHAHANNGVFWALPAMALCKVKRSYTDNPNLRNNHQQLVGLMLGEGIYYYLPVGDKLLKVQELFGLRLSSMSAALVQCCAVEETFIALDSAPGGTVTKGIGLGEGQWGVLPNMPKLLAAFVTVCPSHFRVGAGRESVVAPPREQALVAIVFEDGTFGVWEALGRERLGYSGVNKGQLGITATRCCWLANEHLGILTTKGTIAIVSTACDTLNAHVYSRSLASPMGSPAFLFVTHGFHLKSALELLPVQSGLDSVLGRLERGGVIPPVDASAGGGGAAPSASYVARNVPLTTKVPFRNAFGQLVTQPSPQRTMTLDDELRLHVRYMAPYWLRAKLLAAQRSLRGLDTAGPGRRACSPAAVLATVAYYVSKYMGYDGRQEFWELALQCRGGWRAGRDRDSTFVKREATLRGGGGTTGAFDPPRFNGTGSFVDGLGNTSRSSIYASPREEQAARSDAQQALGDVVDVLCPAPYASPSRLSEALADTRVVRRNKGSLNIQRMHALHLLPFKGVDDSVARLQVARDLINMSELEKAGEVLLETSFDVPSFAFHAQLAINVAAASQPRPLPTALVLACKRAGAMLLAKGDVGGAVEKFALIGEHHEACMALQASGRWMEAAVQARISPSLSLACKLELLHRWVKHRAQRGEVMPSAMLLLRLGAPRAALALLNESPHEADVSGLFGLFMVLGSLLWNRRALRDVIISPSKSDDYRGGALSDNAPLTLGDVITHVLDDYVSLLQSTSNTEVAAKVQRLRSAFAATKAG